MEGEALEFADLARLARAGDMLARDSLAEGLLPRIRGFTRAYLTDGTLWEDAAQESLIRVLRGLSGFSEGNFLGWTMTIAQHACIDISRSEVRHARRFAATSAAVDATDRLELRIIIESAVQRLPEHLRVALLLREQGLPYIDIARTLEVPIGTVRSRLHDARLLLRGHLTHLFADEGDIDDASK